MPKTFCDAGPSCADNVSEWDITWITNMEKPLKQSKYAILILNRPITQNPQFMRRLWNQGELSILS